MFATIKTGVLLGVVAQPVTVETRVARGLPSFTIVGLRDKDARACRERVRCGFRALGREFPLARVTVNLAPADLPKQGAGVDLPVLLSLLAAAGEISAASLDGAWAYAELGLDGRLRAAPGVLAAASAAARSRAGLIIVDDASAPAAAHAEVPVVGATRIDELVAMLTAGVELRSRASEASADALGTAPEPLPGDLADVRGQEQARRAVEIAAAGGHNLLMYGPPGCGKTMLASRLPGILPPLSGAALLEVHELYDAAGQGSPASGRPPFRNPHHTITQSALVGGGSTTLQVGEVSLAHRGVLFLDELPEFRPSALEALREPMEAGAVRLRRSGWGVELPARVQVVAAMNLCRCGRLGSTRGEPCECPPTAVDAYRRRVSGPLLNRFDIAVCLAEPPTALNELAHGQPSTLVAGRVAAARAIHPAPVLRDAAIPTGLVSEPAADLLEDAACRLALAGRTQAAVERVALTIAALDGRRCIDEADMAEALSLRAEIPSAVTA